MKLSSLIFFTLSFVSACSGPKLTQSTNPVSDPVHENQVYQTPDGTLHTGSTSKSIAGSNTITVESEAGSAKGATAADSTNLISGHCDVLNSGALSPCVSVMMGLKTSAGTYESRTDLNGDFSFLVQKGKKYEIFVKSKQYKTTYEPKPPFTAGTQIKILLEPY